MDRVFRCIRKHICVKNKAIVTTNNWAYNNGLPVATIFFIEYDNNQLYGMITRGNASGTLLIPCCCIVDDFPSIV